jgi:hypothetical protein
LIELILSKKEADFRLRTPILTPIIIFNAQGSLHVKKERDHCD